MKKYFSLSIVVIILLSCGKDTPDPASIELSQTGTPLTDPANLEIWVDGDKQAVNLFRVRKANGASRIRLLVDMPDFVRFTLFVTPFELGVQQIESGNVSEEALKYSRTHSEFKQLKSETQFYLYEVDTLFADDNNVEISEIDSIQRIVAGRFRCRMKNVFFVGEPIPESIFVEGNFRAIYQD